MLEGYLEADPERNKGALESSALNELSQVASDDEIRRWRVKQAIRSVGVPIVSSAATTAGSSAFLTFCDIRKNYLPIIRPRGHYCYSVERSSLLLMTAVYDYDVITQSLPEYDSL